MRRVVFYGILLMVSLVGALAQKTSSVSGKVFDAISGRALDGVQITVNVGGKAILLSTDADGRFSLADAPQGNATWIFNKRGYAVEVMDVILPLPNGVLPDVFLRSLQENRLEDVAELALFEVTEGDLSGHNDGVIASLLTASQDPYSNKSGFQFSPMRFRVRGYDSDMQSQYLNGMLMNNMNNGYSSYSLWTGLNSATRLQHNVEGLAPVDYSPGNIGGAMNIITRASGYSKGAYVTLSGSNRTYNGRFMLSYSTGMLPNGWAFSFMGSRRWGNQSYVLGQYYDAWGYFLAAEKRIGNHAIAFTALAAPTERGVASGATQEAYDLVGSNYYNPNMGLQNGKWRNARVRTNHEPILQLQHIWKIDEKNTLTTGVGYRFGFNAYSALNWHNGPDPRADYYRYLPSYYGYMAETPDPYMEEYTRELWLSRSDVRYIDWDRMYYVNRNNYQEVRDANGHLLAKGQRSMYIVEDRRSDQRQFNFSTNLNSIFNEIYRLDAGANFRFNRTDNFNVVKDLLGGSFYYDIDKFSERDFANDPVKYQMDIDNPDRIVKKGDKYGHNYQAVTHGADAWWLFSAKYRRVDAWVTASAGYVQTYRYGLQRRGLFPLNSKGRSEVLTFLEYMGKAGLSYKISGRHYISLNAAWMQKAPYFSDIFVSPRTRNTHVEGITPELIGSTEFSYHIREPRIKGRVTLFYTHFLNQTQNRSFYDDEYRAFSNYLLTNIQSYHAGVEAGIEVKITPALTATAVGTYAQYRYSNNPDYIQTVDNSNKLLESDRVYWDGFHVAGTPQTAANLGLNYRFPFALWLSVDANYFGRSFISMNPVLRTDKARKELDYKFVRQESFPGGITVDAAIGYSTRLYSGSTLRINLSASNILNNKMLRSGGYEQMRVRYTKGGTMMRPFDSKYFYAYGTTVFLNATLQF